jgi:hypothetical protein
VIFFFFTALISSSLLQQEFKEGVSLAGSDLCNRLLLFRVDCTWQFLG